MPTRQERLNYAIAVAARTGKTISDPSVSALGSKVVTVPSATVPGYQRMPRFVAIHSASRVVDAGSYLSHNLRQ
jgi:hypothetical protein